MRRFFLASLFALGLASVDAAEPAVATHMTTPGKVLLADDFAKGFGDGWTAAKGKWEPVDGALRAAEIQADMHGAVARHNLKFTDAVVSFSFKLDGTKQASLSLNGAKGHINRLMIRPTGFSVNKDDQDGKNGPDKGEVLGKCDTEIKPGVWHAVVLELHGGEMLAVLDEKHVAHGQSAAVAKEKTNLGLTCAGEFASFKNLKVCEATPNAEWEKNKAKLLKK